MRRRPRGHHARRSKEALTFIGHCWREDTIQWDSELLTIKHPPKRPPHTVVPRPVQRPHPPLFLACSNPDTVRKAAQYGVGPMVLGFGGPEVIGEMRAMFDDERARRDPDAVVSPGNINDEFVALCPTFLMDDREEAFRKGCRALRFFAESITHWAAPNGVAPARDTEELDNDAFMAEHLQMAKDAIARR